MKSFVFGSMLWFLTANTGLAQDDQILLRQDVALSRPGAVAVLDARLEWGELIVRVHDTNFVRVELVEPAHEQTRGTGGGRAELLIGEQDNVVSIRPTDNPRRRFESAYVTVWVPAESNLLLTMNSGGDIVVHDVSGEIEISNANGSVHLHDVAGAAVVDAVNGEIVGSMRDVNPADMWFTSLNGQVDLTFPPDWRADVTLSTGNGRIRSDFDIDRDVSTARQVAGTTVTVSAGQLNGRVNGGGPSFRLSTRSGDVILRKGTS